MVNDLKRVEQFDPERDAVNAHGKVGYGTDSHGSYMGGPDSPPNPHPAAEHASYEGQVKEAQARLQSPGAGVLADDVAGFGAHSALDRWANSAVAVARGKDMHQPDVEGTHPGTIGEVMFGAEGQDPFNDAGAASQHVGRNVDSGPSQYPFGGADGTVYGNGADSGPPTEVRKANRSQTKMSGSRPGYLPGTVFDPASLTREAALSILQDHLKGTDSA